MSIQPLSMVVIGEDCNSNGRDLLNYFSKTEHRCDYLCASWFNKKYPKIDFKEYDIVICLADDDKIDGLLSMRLLELCQKLKKPLLNISEEKKPDNIDKCKMRQQKELPDILRFAPSLLGTFYELIFSLDCNWQKWEQPVLEYAAQVVKFSKDGTEPIHIENVEPVPDKASVG